MNLKELAHDFFINVFSQDIDLGVSLKVGLAKFNYQVELFSNHEQFLKQSELQIPHLVVVDISSLILPVQDLFQRLLDVSPEIKIFLISPDEYLDSLEHYEKFNLVAAYAKEDPHAVRYVINACNLQCESLVRLYQNEHLLAMYEQERDAHVNVIATLENERKSTSVRPYQTRISDYKTCESKEELLDVFYRHTPQQSWIYLKHVHSIQTYVGVSFHQVPESWVEGLSFKVPQQEFDFDQKLFQGIMPESLKNYVSQKWGVSQLQFIPLTVKDSVEGLLISTQTISADSAEDFSLMSLVYANLMYETQPKYMDVEDSLTGFYNELFFKRVLEKEVDRSKRIFSPISLVKVCIDKLTEIESTHGRQVTDEIIKKVADIIKQTSRLPDYICRTAENEFSLLLVSCGKNGAVLRAERLRSALNAENYSKLGVKLSVSQGISEYPTLAATGLELNLSSTKALNFSSERGGDKICLTKASLGHKPDFAVDS